MLAAVRQGRLEVGRGGGEECGGRERVSLTSTPFSRAACPRSPVVCTCQPMVRPTRWYTAAVFVPIRRCFFHLGRRACTCLQSMTLDRAGYGSRLLNIAYRFNMGRAGASSLSRAYLHPIRPLIAHWLRPHPLELHA